MRRLAPTLAVLALAGCGGGDERETAAGFATDVIELLAAGEAGSAWEHLHPDHRAAVPRALYERCEGTDGFGSPLEEVRVTGVKEEPAEVPGTGTGPSSEVAFRVRLGGETVRFDMHVFDVDGTWGWVIAAGDYAEYAAGRCPG